MLLAIELFDELIFTIREAAWPSIRSELGLSYVQIGLALSIPSLVAAIVEPLFGIVGDTRHRRGVTIAGGVALAVGLAATAVAPDFTTFVVAAAVLYLASGAFVGLSLATLMDLAGDGREGHMVRWVVAGSAGNVLGPLVLVAAIALSLGWRAVFATLAVAIVPLVAMAWTFHPPEHPGAGTKQRHLVRDAFRWLRSPDVVRWLLVLELQDLQGDILLGFLALYLVDVLGTTQSVAGVAVVVWSLAGLTGGVVLIFVTKRLDGVRYLRASTMAAVPLYAGFLVVPGVAGKLGLVAFLGVVTSGWYPIAKARLFAAMPGASGTAMALSSVGSIVGMALPLGIAAAAGAFGLDRAMWLLLIGPIGALALLPRRSAPGSDRA